MKQVACILFFVFLTLPATAQNYWDNDRPSVSDTLNQQNERRRFEEQRQQQRWEMDRLEDENRRLRALDAQRRENRRRDSGSGLLAPRRRR